VQWSSRWWRIFAKRGSLYREKKSRGRKASLQKKNDRVRTLAKRKLNLRHAPCKWIPHHDDEEKGPQSSKGGGGLGQYLPAQGEQIAAAKGKDYQKEEKKLSVRLWRITAGTKGKSTRQKKNSRQESKGPMSRLARSDNYV